MFWIPRVYGRVMKIRQLQEKCKEQQQPLYIALLIDLTKAFDFVSRDRLFKILPKIGCPPKLLSFIKSLHDGTRGTVQYEGSMSEAFNINSGVKQVCVLAPTLFNIFFSVLLKHAFKSTEEGILLRTRSDEKLFNPARLRAKTRVRKVTLRDLFFADDAALVAHGASKTPEPSQPVLKCMRGLPTCHQPKENESHVSGQ